MDENGENAATCVQGCHDALLGWVERHEHIAVSQQCIIIMLQVAYVYLHVYMPSFTSFMQPIRTFRHLLDPEPRL